MKVQVTVLVLLLAACSTAPSGHPPTPALSVGVLAGPPAGAQKMDGGCGETPIYSGGQLPDWATINAPRLPYVLGRPGTILGYIFSSHLTAGDGLHNKVLWYVATPRQGQALVAEGHPLGAAAPAAGFTQPANSWPGEIYPSGPTAPTPGCWTFTLTWLGGAQRAEVDLNFT